MTAQYKDKNWLRAQYVAQRRSTYEIAEKCDVSSGTVGYWLNKHGIETRTPDVSKSARERLRDADWVRTQISERGRSTRSVAADIGVDQTTVLYWAHKHGVETGEQHRPVSDTRLQDKDWVRKAYNQRNKTTKDIAKEVGVSKTTVRDWLNVHGIERRREGPMVADDWLTDPKWVREQYQERGQTLSEIAQTTGVTVTTVWDWVQEHDINTRRQGARVSDDRLADENWLRDQYVNTDATTYDIADALGVSQQTVSYWLNKHGIMNR